MGERTARELLGIRVERTFRDEVFAREDLVNGETARLRLEQQLHRLAARERAPAFDF